MLHHVKIALDSSEGILRDTFMDVEESWVENDFLVLDLDMKRGRNSFPVNRIISVTEIPA